MENEEERKLRERGREKASEYVGLSEERERVAFCFKKGFLFSYYFI